MPVPSQTLLSLMIILRGAKRPIFSTQRKVLCSRSHSLGTLAPDFEPPGLPDCTALSSLGEQLQPGTLTPSWSVP